MSVCSLRAGRLLSALVVVGLLAASGWAAAPAKKPDANELKVEIPGVPAQPKAARPLAPRATMSLEERKAEIDALMLEREVFTDGPKVNALQGERADLIEELMEVEQEWGRRAEE